MKILGEDIRYDDLFDDEDRYNLDYDDDDIMYEMTTFLPKVTGLPSNIKIWTRTDPGYHGHNRYRIKVLKDNVWAALYTVGAAPVCVKDVNRSLSDSEQRKIKEFIIAYSSLIIQLIDDKLSSADVETEILKIRGGKDDNMQQM